MNMKRLFRLILLVYVVGVSVLFLTTCKDDEKEPDRLSVDKLHLEFAARNAGEQSVTVDTNVKDWSIESIDDWIHLTQGDGMFSVKVDNFKVITAQRIGTITVKAGKREKKEISVIQFVDEKRTLSLNPESLSYAAAETGDKTVQVITNADPEDWNVTTSAQWLKVVPNKEKFMFTVTVSDANTSVTAQRTASINVTAGTADPVTLTVTQAVAPRNTLSLNPTSLTFAIDETGTKTVAITTDAGADKWNATTTAQWLTLVKEGLTLKVTIAELNYGTAPRVASISVTAGTANAVTLQVTQAITPKPIIVYDTADGYYFGDWAGKGTAGFAVDSYNASNPNVGFVIEGFSTLPVGGYASFKLITGTYTLAATGAAGTFLAGELYQGEPTGTYVYNGATITLITGGTFDVEVSSDTYTITTNFTGKDLTTGAVVNDILMRYTGLIAFENLSDEMLFTDIMTGPFSATGTPIWLATSGPSTWSGTVTPLGTVGDQYYRFSVFSSLTLNYYCDFKYGKIYIDASTRLGGNASLDAYFRGCYWDDQNMWVIPASYPLEVSYNKTTGALDFGEYIEVGGVQYELGFGILGFAVGTNGTAAWTGSVFTDIYGNLNYQLTPVAPTSKLSNKFVLQKKQGISGMHLKDSTNDTKKNILKVDPSQMMKIPKDQVKIIDVKGFQPSSRK